MLLYIYQCLQVTETWISVHIRMRSLFNEISVVQYMWHRPRAYLDKIFLDTSGQHDILGLLPDLHIRHLGLHALRGQNERRQTRFFDPHPRRRIHHPRGGGHRHRHWHRHRLRRAGGIRTCGGQRDDGDAVRAFRQLEGAFDHVGHGYGGLVGDA